MSIAGSSYYYQPKGRMRADELQILARITALCERLPGYGYRRVTRQLQREGWAINHKRVARIMAEHDLQAETPRAFAVTSDGLAVSPFANLAAEFTPRAANQLWVADLTYIHVLQGFVYLAVILDAWSRKVVGYAISRNMEVRLTLAALKAAVAARRPLPGCIHHSDRGSQYAAAEYRLLLEKHGLVGSMSRKANPYDNAKAESFMKTLKYEEVYLSDYANLAEARSRIGHFLDQVYNRERLHSRIGYVPPEEFKAQLSGLNQPTIC